MRILSWLAPSVLLVIPTMVMAADLSLVSGLYQKSGTKQNDQDDGDSSAIELGGRYGQNIDSKLGWFGQAVTTMRTYDAPSGVKSASNSLSLNIGGGIRYIGKRWNESAVPFLWAMGAYKSDKTA